jgi:hypothetical protein
MFNEFLCLCVIGMFVFSALYMITKSSPIAILPIVGFWICFLALGAVVVTIYFHSHTPEENATGKEIDIVQFLYPNKVTVLAGEYFGETSFMQATIKVYHRPDEQCRIVSTENSVIIIINESKEYILTGMYPANGGDAGKGILFIEPNMPALCIAQ